METTERLRSLIAPIVDDAGADLYDLEYADAVLRVTLDAEGGVGIDLIGKVTRAISRMLDEEDPITAAFTLEVTSPGLERPLRTPDHYRRAVGEEVSIKTRAGVEGDRRFKGTVLAAADQTVTFTTGDSERTLAYEDIERARTVFHWGPAPKPGKTAGKSSSPSTKKKAARS